MNVGQMHIAVNQGVQKIASSQVDLLLPEEIDLELNKAQMKFIKTKLSGIYVLKNEVFIDKRGFFLETFRNQF